MKYFLYSVLIITMTLFGVIFSFSWVYALSYFFIYISIHFLLIITLFLSLYSSHYTRYRYSWILVSIFTLGYILLLYNFPFYIIFYFAIIVGVIGVRSQLDTISKVFWILCILIQSLILIYVRFVPARSISICKNMIVYSMLNPLEGETLVYQSVRKQIGTLDDNRMTIYNIYATQDLLDCLKDKDIKIEYVE